MRWASQARPSPEQRISWVATSAAAGQASGSSRSPSRPTFPRFGPPRQKYTPTRPAVAPAASGVPLPRVSSWLTAARSVLDLDDRLHAVAPPGQERLPPAIAE